MKESNKVVMIPLSKIRPPDVEMRETMTHEGLDELKDSIKLIGLRQAITVRPKGDGYEVVAGARRFECVRSLGWREVGGKNLERTLLDMNLLNDRIMNEINSCLTGKK
jgi:ParB family chromosome partitioning protein